MAFWHGEWMLCPGKLLSVCLHSTICIVVTYLPLNNQQLHWLLLVCVLQAPGAITNIAINVVCLAVLPSDVPAAAATAGGGSSVAGWASQASQTRTELMTQTELRSLLTGEVHTGPPPLVAWLCSQPGFCPQASTLNASLAFQGATISHPSPQPSSSTADCRLAV